MARLSVSPLPDIDPCLLILNLFCGGIFLHRISPDSRKIYITANFFNVDAPTLILILGPKTLPIMSVAPSVPSEIFLVLPVVDSPTRGLASIESVEAQTVIRDGLSKFSRP